MINLENNISKDDLSKVNDINNPPENEPGFESSSSDDIFDSFDSGDPFDSSGSSSGSDLFGGSSSSDPFGSSSSNDPFDNSGSSDPFGGQSNGFNNGFGGGFNSGFGGFGQPQQPVEQKPDAFDKAAAVATETAGTTWELIVELAKSLSLRNLDDIGYLSRNFILSGAVISCVSLLLCIIGTVTGIEFISFGGFGLQSLLTGLLAVSVGLIGIGVSAFILEKRGSEVENSDMNALPDIKTPDDEKDNYESNIDSENDDLMDSEFDDLFNSLDSDEPAEDTKSVESKNTAFEDFNIDDNNLGTFSGDGVLGNIDANQYISRENLLSIFLKLLPLKTPSFGDRKEIEESDNQFTYIQTACLKALSNIMKCELDQVDSKLESVYESYFSYEIKMKRVKGVDKLDAISVEIERYFRENSSDTGVSATVTIEGDFYKIIVTKGNTAVVTMGDAFKLDYVKQFFEDRSNKLPIITGITELGKVVLSDAKKYDTMLIAGKPRSGKSWYVLGILMSMCLFNSPEDVQFIIIDPKESNLFNTFSLLPHVCGLHNDSRIMQIFDDVINNEAPRRKKLLSDNRCDDIWSLRKKGINIPVLYIVIDEYITVMNNLGEDKKEFNLKFQTILTQFPSLGIRLLFVPHRATGVVDKTNRTLLQFAASVKGERDDILDTLGIQKWTKPLVNPGDIALKTTDCPDALYVRGAALTADDDSNAEFIRTAAKIFYKMGVDIPDMSELKIACNRDMEHIKSELSDNADRQQFNAENVLDELSNI